MPAVADLLLRMLALLPDLAARDLAWREIEEPWFEARLTEE